MKNILILGATGFIGKNITKFFSKKYNIKATYNIKKPFDDKNIDWIKCDLRNQRDLSNIFKNIDIVIQAAATTSGSKDIVNQPYLHVTDNAVMNSLILKEIYTNRISHFIFFSCTVMYESSKKKQKEKEFNYNINEKYFGVGWTKVYIEKMCDFFSKISNTKFTVIRHSNIYGPYDKFDLHKSHVFGATITKVLTSKKNIEIWGTGQEKRDFLYVSDLINFVDLVIKKQKNKFEIYNCGSSQSISIHDLVKLIIKVSRKKLEITYNLSAPTINFDLLLDSTKAFKDLSWEPKVSLEEGIKKTLSWWKKNYNETK